MTPPTRLAIPKSSTPNVLKSTLDVYNDTTMLNSILPYSIKVFFAMRLVFSEWFCIRSEPDSSGYCRIYPKILAQNPFFSTGRVPRYS